MSKSLGNFTTIRALLESGLSAMTLRLFVLQAHYRKPLDFTAEALEAATTGWKGLNAALSLGDLHAEALGWGGATPMNSGAVRASKPSANDTLFSARQRFSDAMDDDLNSSGALAVLFDLARPLRALANRLDRGDAPNHPDEEGQELQQRWLLLRELAGVLGLRLERPSGKEAETDLDSQAIEAAIEARRLAKQSKDFAEADRIRAELTAQGIELIDKPGGITEWRRG